MLTISGWKHSCDTAGVLSVLYYHQELWGWNCEQARTRENQDHVSREKECLNVINLTSRKAQIFSHEGIGKQETVVCKSISQLLFEENHSTNEKNPDVETLRGAASVTAYCKPLVPGCCSKCRDPSLEDSHEELEGVFFNYYKIYQRKEDATMDDEPHYHCDHIHPQLPRNHLQVSNGDDLSTDEAGNTERRIPDGTGYGCN